MEFPSPDRKILEGDPTKVFSETYKEGWGLISMWPNILSNCYIPSILWNQFIFPNFRFNLISLIISKYYPVVHLHRLGNLCCFCSDPALNPWLTVLWEDVFTSRLLSHPPSPRGQLSLWAAWIQSWHGCRGRWEMKHTCLLSACRHKQESFNCFTANGWDLSL